MIETRSDVSVVSNSADSIEKTLKAYVKTLIVGKPCTSVHESDENATTAPNYNSL